MQNLIFKGLNGHLKIAAATQYITRIKDSTKKQHVSRPCSFGEEVVQADADAE